VADAAGAFVAVIPSCGGVVLPQCLPTPAGQVSSTFGPSPSPAGGGLVRHLQQVLLQQQDGVVVCC
jgi:hypothetical protein